MDFAAPFSIHEMNEKPLRLALTESDIEGAYKGQHLSDIKAEKCPLS